MTEPILYRLDRTPPKTEAKTPLKAGAKGKAPHGLWAAFTPGGHGLRRTWQLAVATRTRGGASVVAPLLETGVLRPLATVTVRGEAFPLTIDWHELRRGGVLCFGGERKLGSEGGVVSWEMRWLPDPAEPGAFGAEMRVRAEPRRTGGLRIDLPAPLFQPDLWRISEGTIGEGTNDGAGRQRAKALSAWSAYSAHAVGVVAPDGELSWGEAGGFALDWPPFSLGGGRMIRFGLRFGAAKTTGDARAALVTQCASFAPAPHPVLPLRPLDPAATVARLSAPDAYDIQGMERLYLKPPVARPGDEGSHYAGLPHEPAGALKALGDWHRLRETPAVPRLVRFGAQGLCADFQVMGRAGEPEPNKGAFWDKLTCGVGTDGADGPTHGLRSNARLAWSLFQLHAQAGEPLLAQSALNICQWLLLKQNAAGFYDGASVHATRGLSLDGKFLPQPCALDGAEAIRAFVPAYRHSGTDVWIKAAWKVADFLLSARTQDFDCHAPAEVAAVILSLLALDAESPNPRLRTALRDWAAWLRLLPLSPDAPGLSPDGLHAGLYDCAQAGFGLWGMTRDLAHLRYAFAALSRVPPDSQARSWRAVAAHQSALLSLAGLLPGSALDYDAPSVTLDWRVFRPDPAAAPFLRVQPAGSGWADWLPLVCRGTDQLLLLVLAAPETEAVGVWKNGRRPLLRDLRTGTLDSEAPLGPVARDAQDAWARVGLFTIDP